MLSIPWRTGVNMREFAYYGTSAAPHTQVNLQDAQLAALKGLGVKAVRFWASRHDMTTADTVKRVRSAVDKIGGAGMQAVICLDDGLRSGFSVPGAIDFHTETGGHIHSRYWVEQRYAQDYLPHVRAIVSEVKANPAVLMWELGNEYALHPREPGRRESQAFLQFAAAASDMIKSISPTHLVSTGLVNSRHVASLTEDNVADFARRLYGLDGLDVISIHYYEHDGEKNFASIDLDAARDLKKPVYVGEVGMSHESSDRARYYRDELRFWRAAGAFTTMVWAFDTSERDAGVSDKYAIARIYGDFGALCDVIKAEAADVPRFALSASTTSASAQSSVDVTRVAGGAGGTFPGVGIATSAQAPLPAVPPFRLLMPFTWAHIVRAKFDDPANYGGNALQKREGNLYVPANANAPLPLRAAQRGYVQKVGSFPPGYGNFVVLRHDWYGDTYTTWYGHMERITVTEGQYVNAGDAIGFAGRSGSASETCLFFTVQYLGKGKSNYVIDDVVDPAPLLADSLPARDEAWWNADVNVPDGTLLQPGTPFKVTWQVRNAGNTIWDSRYQIVFFSGAPMGTGAAVEVPRAAPGELVLISVNLIAPMAFGEHKSAWILKNSSGNLFRQEMYTFVNVQPKSEQSKFSLARFSRDVTIPDGTQVSPGQKFTKTWEILNDGKTTWDKSFSLFHVRDERMGGPERKAFPDVRPGRKGEISLDLTAPTAPGTYRSTWQPRDPDGNPFDFEMYAEIQVQQAGQQPRLNPNERFGSPVVGDYNIGWRYLAPVPYGDGKHKGVDYVSKARVSGLLIRAGGNGVTYNKRFICTACSAQQPNFLSQNLSQEQQNAAFSNEKPWVFGFGNMLVVRYAYNDLPSRARQEMDRNGQKGWFAYVLYAHLEQILVEPNTPVSAGMPIARMGNTGNSTAPHLHLEIQLSQNANANIPLRSIPRMDPLLMFAE